MGLEVIAIAGILLLGAGITILVFSIRSTAGAATLDQIGTYGYVAEAAGGSEVDPAGGRTKPLDSLAGRLGDITARRLSRFSENEVRQKLVSAGMYGTSPRKVLGYQVLLAVALTIFTLWAVPVFGGSLIFAVIAGAAAGVFGWFAPMAYVDRRMRTRFDKIDRQMPDMIDLLVVTIEAGLGILASMRVAADGLADPLGQELRLTLQEQRMGLSVFEAIESLGRRADAPNVRIFVRALIQGEKLGVSIGTTMRNVALEMRKRRKAVVEEKAQKMPVKLLFPLVFLIFPAIMIVLLVPAIIHISEVL
jgi:tight adherence protein C